MGGEVLEGLPDAGLEITPLLGVRSVLAFLLAREVEFKGSTFLLDEVFGENLDRGFFDDVIEGGVVLVGPSVARFLMG